MYSTAALRTLQIADQIAAVRAGLARPDQLGPNAATIYYAGGVSTALPTAAAVAAAAAQQYQVNPTYAGTSPATVPAAAPPPPPPAVGAQPPESPPIIEEAPVQPPTGAGGPTGPVVPPSSYPSAPAGTAPSWDSTEHGKKLNSAWEYARTTLMHTLPQTAANLENLSHRTIRGA